MIYFDLTRVLEWEGRYTGMERVAYELAANLSDKGDNNDIRLLYFIPTKGFIDITEHVSWKSGVLKSVFARQESLRKLLHTHPLRALKLYIKRKVQTERLSQFKTIVLDSSSTLFISDGLWDRQDYIDAVIKAGKEGVKVAHLVHDMVPLAVPHVCHDYVTTAIKDYFTAIAPYMDVLISISKNTEKDFLHYFGDICKSGMQRVIVRHGEDFTDMTEQKPSMIGDVTNFILCVGTIEIRKNHILLYQAYKLAIQQGVDLPPLVIVGRSGWLAEQTLKLVTDDPEMEGKIILAGPVNDAELVWLYKNCSFTTMAALYEGWGLQIAESLYYGKVCASSNAGPMPEVGGELNVYFSPYNTQECLDALVRLASIDTRKSLENKIKSQYRATTWRQAANSIREYL